MRQMSLCPYGGGRKFGLIDDGKGAKSASKADFIDNFPACQEHLAILVLDRTFFFKYFRKKNRVSLRKTCSNICTYMYMREGGPFRQGRPDSSPFCLVGSSFHFSFLERHTLPIRLLLCRRENEEGGIILSGFKAQKKIALQVLKA